MTSSDTAIGTPPAPRRRLRVPFPLAAILVGAAVVIVVWLLPRILVDLGTRRAVTVVTTLIVSALLLGWFVLFSQARGTTRLITLLIALAVVGAAIGSVRRVEFTGDLTPIFDWRWTTDRDVALEQHRAAATLAERALPAHIEIGPLDVLEYRGPQRDGIVQGPALARDWDSQPPRKVWRQPVGGGYAAFVLAGPLAVTIEQRRDREAIVAYDADTGAEIWVHDYPALFSERLGGDGPRATPTIVDDRIYALGATGVLTCLELASGQPLWSINILEENQADNIDWGMAGSPLVYGGLVIVNPGSQGDSDTSHAVLAIDAETGGVQWKSGIGPAGYASPMLVDLAGRRQVLMFEGLQLAGYDADGGKQLWGTPWKTDYNINAAQPIVLGDDRVLITSNTGCAVFDITESNGEFAVAEVWKNRNLKGQYVSPIRYGDYLYGLDDGIMVCLSLADGKRQWKKGRFGNGQMLLTGDLLVILSEQGELVLVEASPEQYTELGRIQAIEGRTWNNPTLRDGRIFVRNHLEMAAYDLPLAEVVTDGAPPSQDTSPSDDTPVSDAEPAAHDEPVAEPAIEAESTEDDSLQ